MNTVFRCADCDVQLKSKSDVATHMKSLHKGSPITTCKECNPISWMKESSVKQHKINFHSGRNAVKKLNIPNIGMISFQKPPQKSNLAIGDQNPQQKLNISNIKMISMGSAAKQQHSKPRDLTVEAKLNKNFTPPISKAGVDKPVVGNSKQISNVTRTIIIEDEQTPVSNKTANKQALIEKLLKQQLDRKFNNTSSPKASRKDNSLVNSNVAKNVKNIVKPDQPEGRINLAKYIKPSENFKRDSEKSNSIENTNIKKATTAENSSVSLNSEKRKDHNVVEKSCEIMSSDIKKTKNNKLKEFNKTVANVPKTIENTSKLIENYFKPIESTPMPVENTPKPFQNALPSVENVPKPVENVPKDVENVSVTVENVPKLKTSLNLSNFKDQTPKKCESLKFIKVNFNKKATKIVDMPKEEIPLKLGKRKRTQSTKSSILEKQKKLKIENQHLRRSTRLSRLNESINDSGFGSDSSILDPGGDLTKPRIDNNENINNFSEDSNKNLQSEADLKFEEELNNLWNEELSRDHPSTCHCPNCIKCKGPCCDNGGVRAGKCCDPQTLGKCINPGDIYCYASCCYTVEGEVHGLFNATESQPIELLNPMNLIVNGDDYAWAESVIGDVELGEEFEDEYVDPYYDFNADNIIIEPENSVELDMWNNENSLLSRILKLECESKTEAKGKTLRKHMNKCKLCNYLLKTETVSKRLMKPNKKRSMKAKLTKKTSRIVSKEEFTKNSSRMLSRANDVKKTRSKNISDCHDWKDGGPSLPAGWKICTEYRATGANKASDTYYLSPTMDFFRSRKKVLEYLKENNAHAEDLELVKNGYGFISAKRNQWTYDSSSHISSLQKPTSSPLKPKEDPLEKKANPSMKDILNSIVIEDDSDTSVINDMDTSEKTIESPLIKNLQETISNLRKKSEDWIKGDNRLHEKNEDTKETFKNIEASDKNYDFIDKYKKAKEDCKETMKRMEECLKSDDNNVIGNREEVHRNRKETLKIIEESLKTDELSKNNNIEDNYKQKEILQKEVVPEITKNVLNESLPELPEGWTSKFVDTQFGRHMVYISPNGIRFKSPVKVLNYLNSLKTSRKDIKMFERIITATQENGNGNIKMDDNKKHDNSLKNPILNKIKFKL